MRIGLLIALVALAGCGSGVYPVKGKITFEGKPMVGGGSISFVPVGNQPGKAAGGEIAADGSYTMTTNSPGDGSMPGEFRVVINQVVHREPNPSNDGERAGTAIEVVKPADRIPEVYGNPKDTPLKIKVEAKSLNEVDFDLKRNATKR